MLHVPRIHNQEAMRLKNWVCRVYWYISAVDPRLAVVRLLPLKFHVFSFCVEAVAQRAEDRRVSFVRFSHESLRCVWLNSQRLQQ
jgi:hypothetical protein